MQTSVILHCPAFWDCIAKYKFDFYKITYLGHICRPKWEYFTYYWQIVFTFKSATRDVLFSPVKDTGLCPSDISRNLSFPEKIIFFQKIFNTTIQI